MFKWGLPRGGIAYGFPSSRGARRGGRGGGGGGPYILTSRPPPGCCAIQSHYREGAPDYSRDSNVRHKIPHPRLRSRQVAKDPRGPNGLLEPALSADTAEACISSARGLPGATHLSTHTPASSSHAHSPRASSLSWSRPFELRTCRGSHSKL